MCSDLFFDVGVPCSMSREGFEVSLLEVYDDCKISLSLSGKCSRSTAVVRAVAKFLAHEASRVMSIVRLFCKLTVDFQGIRPRKAGPTDSGDGCMEVT